MHDVLRTDDRELMSSMKGSLSIDFHLRRLYLCLNSNTINFGICHSNLTDRAAELLGV